MALIDYISYLPGNQLQPILNKINEALSLNIYTIPSPSPNASGPTVNETKIILNNNAVMIRCCIPSYFHSKSKLIPLVAPTILPQNFIPYNIAIKNDEPYYCSVLISSIKCNIKTVDDLKNFKGKLTLSVNDLDSLSGYHSVKIWLKKHNLSTKILKEVVIAGAHKDSLTLISSGKADIAAIDINVLNALHKQGILKTHKFNYIEGEYVINHAPVVCVSKAFIKKHNIDVKTIQDAFIKASKDEETYLKEKLSSGLFVACDVKKLNETENILKKMKGINVNNKHNYICSKKLIVLCIFCIIFSIIVSYVIL